MAASKINNNQRVGAHATRVSTSGVTGSTACTLCARLLTGAPTRVPIGSAIICTSTLLTGFLYGRGVVRLVASYPAARPTYSLNTYSLTEQLLGT